MKLSLIFLVLAVPSFSQVTRRIDATGTKVVGKDSAWHQLAAKATTYMQQRPQQE